MIDVSVDYDPTTARLAEGDFNGPHGPAAPDPIHPHGRIIEQAQCTDEFEPTRTEADQDGPIRIEAQRDALHDMLREFIPAFEIDARLARRGLK